MRRTQTLFVFLMVVSFCLAAAPSTENDDAGRIIQEALKPSPLESNLRHLTDEIGGRVPGTPAMQRAVEWGIEGLKTAGADSVHTEEFTMPHSWSEGATEMAVSATGTALDDSQTRTPPPQPSRRRPPQDLHSVSLLPGPDVCGGYPQAFAGVPAAILSGMLGACLTNFNFRSTFRNPSKLPVGRRSKSSNMSRSPRTKNPLSPTTPMDR